MAMAKRNADEAETKLQELQAEIMMQSLRVSSSTLPNSVTAGPICVGGIRIRSHALRKFFHNLRHIFRKIKKIILSN
jgi:hypothetical protein